MNDTTPSLAEKAAPPSGPPKRWFHSVTLWVALAVILTILIPLGARNGPESLFFSLITFLEVILLFNILIIVHELGHFLAAKRCGLQIDKFAIWFGKPLWSKKVDGVEYILGSIPAGGYVALPQMAPMEAIEGKTDTPREELPPASPWQKIIVAFAGPLFSFGLALVFASIVWVVGKPVSYSEATTTIGFVVPGDPADKAGMMAGDKILSIDGHPINHFMGMGDSVIWRIVTSTADTIPIVVQRGSQTLTFTVAPQKDPDHSHAWWQRGATRKIGVGPADESLVIKKILPDSPALTAGLKPNDQITQMNGRPLYSSAAVSYWLKDHPLDPIQFQILRNGAAQTVTVQPVKPISPSPMPKDAPQTDIGIDEWANSVRLIHPSPFQQVRESVEAVTGTIAALLTPKSNIGASQLSGPVGIMNIFFVVLSSDNGWRYALWLAVLINVNLAILNLFPLPVLDGGHITLSIIEWIRRRPLSMSILEPLQTACALALIGYMAFITFFDVQDSGKMAFGSGDQEIKFAPRQTAP
ncbi:MAG TPA: RIP metalloprotease RseP [Candidatus Methylacidiphilales bacterium]|jgi:regulator of sigma E protease|nr:RIP metalloprotease RseP [Candidatus Methylacidiphilales bacterium]